MKIQILDDAQQDLIEAFQFYESREAGVGSYFLDRLFSDIDSLLLSREFIKSFMAIIVAF